MTVTPGSKQVFTMIAESGALADLIGAGARVLEAACGPCLGIGQAPATGLASMRSMNRNFKGRSGTADDNVFLASPEACAAAALTGVITDPRTLGDPLVVVPPRVYAANDNMIIPPRSGGRGSHRVLRGPNSGGHWCTDGQFIEGTRTDKGGRHITTDHILPQAQRCYPGLEHTAIRVLLPARDPASSPRQGLGRWHHVGRAANYGQGIKR